MFVGVLFGWAEGPGAVVVDLDGVAVVGDHVVVGWAEVAEELVAGEAVLGVLLDVVAFEVLGGVTAVGLRP